MPLKNLYPISFDNSASSYTSLMRTLLIKGTYDSTLKKLTGYQGMHQCHYPKECWTLKFEPFKGIFGITFTKIDEESIAHFQVHYFPSTEEQLNENFSLLESFLSFQEDFIEKVRSFSLYPELYTQFYIGSLQMYVEFEEEMFFIGFKTLRKDKTYSKEGILSPINQTTYIIEPGDVDRNLPTLRLMLPLINYVNMSIHRLSDTTPISFFLFKKQHHIPNISDLGKSYYSQTKIVGLINYSKKNNKVIQIISKLSQKSTYKSVKTINLLDFIRLKPWGKNTLFSNEQNVQKPKFIVVTGFLGAGKTQLLKHFIEYETQRRKFIGIIQNEIGSIGLDEKLIDYNYSLVAMDEGCVCCSLAGQLRTAITRLSHPVIPDTIILETTGVANPFNLLSELHSLEDLVDFESIITVVDGLNAYYLSHEYAIFLDQIRAADILLLNKTDLMKEEDIIKTENWLKENNRCAKIIRTVHSDISPGTLSLDFFPNTAHLASFLEINHKTHTQEQISSIKISLTKPLNKKLFKQYLQTLPSNIFRLKGIITFEDEPNQYIIQYVNGNYELVQQAQGSLYETFLVYIGKNLKQQYIKPPY